ncbi:MAG: short-chain dehydrogenase, partial [Candidatus Thorarchaeota archaeon]
KRNLVDRISKDPQISATALYYLGVSNEIEGINGKFFNLTKEEEPAPPALDKDVAEELWHKSIEMAGLE